MKIAVVLYGAIRVSFDSLKKIILMHKNMFESNINIHFFICSFLPVENPKYNIPLDDSSRLYEYNFNLNELKKQVDSLDLNVTYIFNKQPDLNKTIKTRNKRESSDLYLLHYYKYFYNYIKENNLYFDYVIRSRNDMYINISNIQNYFTDDIVVFPNNLHPNKACAVNDLFFIIPNKCYNKYYNIHKRKLVKILKKSWDAEQAEFLFLKLLQNKTIHKMINIDIKYVKNERHHHWHLENGKYIG